MCKDAHNFRKTMNLTDIEEFKDFHLKPKTSIDKKQGLKRAKWYFIYNIAHYFSSVTVTQNFEENDANLLKKNKK
jgi:hypothetical protein